MKTKYILSSLMALTLLAGGCSKDDADGMATDGNRVVFTLGGSTRAAGDNDTHSSLASTAEEKQIDNLIAVAFTTDGNYYKSFETEYDALQNTATFDLEKNGTYDIYFVANADETLSESLMTLTDQTADTQVTADDLSKLVVTQAVGKKDGVEEWHPFVMLSDGAKRVVSQHGSVTNGGLIMMRRLAVRFDLVNAADGVTITSVKFVNRVKESLLAAANDMSFADAGTLYEDKIYADVNLAGSFADPKSYVATIYSYENVNTGAEHLPALEITYTMDGYTLTHTVKFYDSTDESGTKPLALKRNYLYRIVLTKPLNVEFDITVEDWNTADAFQITDLPFEKHDQAALNAKLKVNMFTPYNVLSLNKSSKMVSFYTSLAISAEACPATSYFTYNWLAGKEEGTYSSNGANMDTDLRGETFIDDSGAKYRIPTMGEMQLLVPAVTLPGNRPYVDDSGKWIKEADGSGNGVYYCCWNDNSTSNAGQMRMVQYDEYGAPKAFTETVYLKNKDDGSFKPDESGEKIVGESYLRLGKKVETVENDGLSYNIYPVYGLRFKGSDQYAAYRWESCKIDEDPNSRYLSIKIKALPADSKLTIDDIVDDNVFWKDGYIEYKFPTTGYFDTNVLPNTLDDNCSKRGVCTFAWTQNMSTLDDYSACALGSGLDVAFQATNNIVHHFPLRLVKVSEE